MQHRRCIPCAAGIERCRDASGPAKDGGACPQHCHLDSPRAVSCANGGECTRQWRRRRLRSCQHVHAHVKRVDALAAVKITHHRVLGTARGLEWPTHPVPHAWLPSRSLPKSTAGRAPSPTAHGAEPQTPLECATGVTNTGAATQKRKPTTLRCLRSFWRGTYTGKTRTHKIKHARQSRTAEFISLVLRPPKHRPLPRWCPVRACGGLDSVSTLKKNENQSAVTETVTER